METNNAPAQWLMRGAQKRAVAKAIGKPMLISEIHREAVRVAPRMRLKHVRPILEAMMSLGLVTCLTSDKEAGAVYAYTEHGIEAVKQAFEMTVSAVPSDVDWNLYSQVARAKTREAVLGEVAAPFLDGTVGKTASQVRKNLLSTYPLSLNPVIETLKFLREAGLVEIIGETDKRSLSRYHTTEKGARMIAMMR